MYRRVAMAAVLSAALIFAGGAGVSTPGSETSSGGSDEQAELQHAQLVEQRQQVEEMQRVHHEKLVDLMERVEQAQLEYQERMQSELGDRAPTETIPPVETIPPMETVPPAN